VTDYILDEFGMTSLEYKAWYLYCADTIEDPHASYYWDDLPLSVRQLYLEVAEHGL
jgi:hypothetical protein